MLTIFFLQPSAHLQSFSLSCGHIKFSALISLCPLCPLFSHQLTSFFHSNQTPPTSATSCIHCQHFTSTVRLTDPVYCPIPKVKRDIDPLRAPTVPPVFPFVPRSTINRTLLLLSLQFPTTYPRLPTFFFMILPLPVHDFSFSALLRTTFASVCSYECSK